MEQVPYRGGGQAINDLMGGHIKLGSLGSTPLIPHYKAGTLRLLAQTTKTRSPSLPDVPTYEEAGMKGLVLDQWLGVFVPAGTPPAITALSTARSARRSPIRRCARTSSIRRRSRPAERPSSSRSSFATITPSTGGW